MNNKNADDADLVARYKAVAALRLAELRAKNTEPSVQPNETRDAVPTVRFAHNAKPLSVFGSVTEVLGPSRIRIPEYKLHRS